jgi:hypothetical protein
MRQKSALAFFFHMEDISHAGAAQETFADGQQMLFLFPAASIFYLSIVSSSSHGHSVVLQRFRPCRCKKTRVADFHIHCTPKVAVFVEFHFVRPCAALVRKVQLLLLRESSIETATPYPRFPFASRIDVRTAECSCMQALHMLPKVIINGCVVKKFCIDVSPCRFFAPPHRCKRRIVLCL